MVQKQRLSLTEWVVIGICILVALYVLVFPLQDYDTFWHLAYGRAMLDQSRFINHEIFSYTASGTYLGSHSQLAQVILWSIWSVGGAGALLGFKLVIAVVVFVVLWKTVRLFGVGVVTASIISFLVLVSGTNRFVERPELFSILFQAVSLFVLFGWIQGRVGRLALWTLPLMMVVWDYLHGALFGLVILLTFAVAEAGKYYFSPRTSPYSCWRSTLDQIRFRQLMSCFGVTLVAMVLHPNGLLNYSAFWKLTSHASDFAMYGEFMAPRFSAQFFWYWVVLFAVTPLTVLFIRRIDLTALIVVMPFAYLSLKYNRATLAFCIAAVPLAAQGVRCAGDWLLSRLPRTHWFGAALVAAVLVSALIYKQYFAIGNFRFGTGVNANVFPVGSVRFVQAVGLQGNMYNMDGYGGYLAFWLGPERKIFHYNQPGVFTALTDFVHKPDTRSQWNIRYAIIGKAEEWTMLRREGFVPVYWEPTGMVMVRPSVENAAFLERYQIRYFQPLMNDAQFMALGRSPYAGERLRQEMADYLTFREDRKIADLFVELLQSSKDLSETKSLTLVKAALNGNPEHAGLLFMRRKLT